MTIADIIARDHHQCRDCGQQDKPLVVHCCLGPTSFMQPDAMDHFYLALCGDCRAARAADEDAARRNLAMCFTTSKDAPRCLAEALQEVAQAKTAGWKVCIKVEVLVAE